MMRDVASEPFAIVATSLVTAFRAVVVYKSTFSTNHVIDPSKGVSVFGSEIAIRSPISNGFLTNIKRIPCSIAVLADEKRRRKGLALRCHRT